EISNRLFRPRESGARARRVVQHGDITRRPLEMSFNEFQCLGVFPLLEESHDLSFKLDRRYLRMQWTVNRQQGSEQKHEAQAMGHRRSPWLSSVQPHYPAGSVSDESTRTHRPSIVRRPSANRRTASG